MIITIIYGFLLTLAIASSIPPFLDARWFGREFDATELAYLKVALKKEQDCSIRRLHNRLALAAFFGLISLSSATVCWLVS